MGHDGTSRAQDTPAGGPASFPAAVSALRAIDRSLRTARRPQAGTPAARPGTEQALAALLLLREVRERLDGWESGLIETARRAGASWTDLAAPLGVASRQAAERRYLRLRPSGAAGSTGDERVKAERDRRAADRTVTVWARAQAAELRRLAGQITSLRDLPEAARAPVADLTRALGDDDAARLLEPLVQAVPHLAPGHPDLAARTRALADRTEKLRRDSDHRRRTLQ